MPAFIFFPYSFFSPILICSPSTARPHPMPKAIPTAPRHPPRADLGDRTSAGGRGPPGDEAAGRAPAPPRGPAPRRPGGASVGEWGGGGSHTKIMRLHCAREGLVFRRT